MAYVGYPQIPGVTPLRESGARTREDWADFDARRQGGGISKDKLHALKKANKEPGEWTPEDEEQDRRMSRMTPPSVRRAGGISKKELDARRKARGKVLYRGNFGGGGRSV